MVKVVGMYLTVEEARNRISHCEGCEHLNTENMSCSECGCPIIDIMVNAMSFCPINNFTALSKGDEGWAEFPQQECVEEYEELKARVQNVY